MSYEYTAGDVLIAREDGKADFGWSYTLNGEEVGRDVAKEVVRQMSSIDTPDSEPV